MAKAKRKGKRKADPIARDDPSTATMGTKEVMKNKAILRVVWANLDDAGARYVPRGIGASRWMVFDRMTDEFVSEDLVEEIDPTERRAVN